MSRLAAIAGFSTSRRISCSDANLAAAKMAFRNRQILQKEIENCRLLVESAENNDVQIMRTLLERGTSVNAEEYNRTLFYKSKNYLTPLQIASQKGFVEPVKLLIEYEGSKRLSLHPCSA